MAETIEQLIRRIAAEEGVDPNLAIAVARQESGLNPKAYNGKGESSVGLFQLNQNGGMGTGYDRKTLEDPELNARISIRAMAQTQKRTGLTGGQLAAASQRPADPQGYARSVNAMLAGGQGQAHQGSPFSPGGTTVVAGATAPGASAVASNTKSNTIAAAEKKVEQARAAFDRLDAPRQAAFASGVLGPNDADWNTGLVGTTDAAGTRVEKPSPRVEAWQRAQKALQDAEEELAKAQDADTTRAPATVSTSTTEPYIVTRQSDGSLKSEPNPNYKGPATPARRTQVVGNNIIDMDTGAVVAQVPAAPKDRRTQVVAGNLIDLDTGDVIAKVPRDARTQVVGNNLIDLDTGRVLAALPEKPGTLTAGNRVYPLDPKTGLPVVDQGVRLPSDPKTVTVGNRVYPVNPDTGLPIMDQGIDLPRDPQTATVNGRVIGIDPATGKQLYSTDTMTPDDRAAADQDRQLTTQGKQLGLEAQRAQIANAQRLSDPYGELNRLIPLKEQEAKAERERIAGLNLPTEQKRGMFESWWAANVEAPLAGARAMAERQRRADEVAQEAAQRAEDDRAAALNRERDRAGYVAGEQERAKWRELAPMARSNEFVQEYANNVGKMSRGERVTFDPAAITAPVALPNLDQMAQQGAARALAAISPTAARIVGKPLPVLPPDLDISKFVPDYAPAT